MHWTHQALEPIVVRVTLERRRFAGLAAATLVMPALTCRAALAQAWPSRFVRLIVPFPAGAAPDLVGRLLAARLSAIWGQQVIVENRPGAAGNIGAQAVARAAPDGYTLLKTAFPFAVNPFLYRSTGYDPVADFAPVTLVSVQPCVMLVPNSSPAHSVAGFIAHAGANKGRISYGSAGGGTSPHLAGELFKRMAGIEMTHVPSRSAAQQDLIAGRVDVLFAVAGTAFPLMRAGRARGLAVTGRQRLAAAPELPTVAEAGVPGFEVTPWSGFLLPAKTRPAVVERIRADTAAVLADPGVREKLEQVGVTPVGSTPGEFAAYLEAEMSKWGPVIRDAKITAED
jgi:tripartite-type tricarboxylate transporter receptor subunit TctC